MNAAVFLERDGILNHYFDQSGNPVVPSRFNEFQPCLDALAPLKRLKSFGFLLIATTNQPGVSRGDLSRSDLDLMHTLLRRTLPLDDILYCPHDDRSHPHFKPYPGMFLEAAFQWKIGLNQSFVISDKWFDSQAARVAGCTSIIIPSPWSGHNHHDLTAQDLGDAVEKVLMACNVLARHSPPHPVVKVARSGLLPRNTKPAPAVAITADAVCA